MGDGGAIRVIVKRTHRVQQAQGAVGRCDQRRHDGAQPVESLSAQGCEMGVVDMALHPRQPRQVFARPLGGAQIDAPAVLPVPGLVDQSAFTSLLVSVVTKVPLRCRCAAIVLMPTRCSNSR